MATRFVVRSIKLTASTEEAYQLPFGTKSMIVQCRTAVDLKIASRKGSVEGATAPGEYFTIKSGTVTTNNKLDVQDNEVWIYLAAASAVTAEIICTYDDSYKGGNNAG